MRMMFKISDLHVDNNLMYLIQKVSKDKTGDILMYFYNISLSIAEDYASRHPKRRVDKTLEWHYRDTAVPYRLVVYTRYHEDFTSPVVPLNVGVRFPTKRDMINVTEIMDSIVEQGLGLEGSTALPDFKEPRTRVPAGFKKLLHR
jgi:hypothetical protein